MIKEIELKRLKSFKDSGKLCFSSINLLTGKNGRGKSTVLQSLLLLAQSFDAEKGIDRLVLNGQFVRLGTFDDVIRRGSGIQIFSIAYKTDDDVDNAIICEFEKDKDDLRSAAFHELTINGNSKMETVSSEILTTENGEWITAEDRAPLLLESGQRTVGTTSDVMGFRQLINIIFISADREGGKDSVKTNRPWNRQMGVGIHGEYVMNMLEVSTQEERDAINKWLSIVLDGGYVRTEANPDNEEIAMYIDPAGSDKGFKPSNVGFGYSYILSILTAMLMARKGAKMIVENPEAHLHPAAQARLVKVMVEIAKEKDMQVFIESHSDHVLHGLQLAVMGGSISHNELSVLFFDFDNIEPNLTVVYQLEVTSNGHIRKPPYGFFDQAEQDLSILIGL